MQLVDLADEYQLTTADAIEVCLAAGIGAESSDTVLNAAQVAAFRDLAEQQRAWKSQADEAMVLARQAKEATRSKPSSFGPIPPVPWDQAGRSTEAGISIAPQTNQPPTDLDARWVAESASSAQVSPYAAGALALSIVSLIFPFIPAIIAVPLALYARERISKSRGTITGERLAQAALAVSAIGVLLWLGLLGASLYNDQQERNARNSPVDLQVDTEVLSWDQIEKGDCVRLPHADLSVPEWQGVSCAAPHEGEVFASLRTPTVIGAKYPGRGPLYAAAKEQCTIEFEKYVGRPYALSELKIAAYFPTASNWVDNDDRTFGCVAYEEGYALINGSLAGVNR